MKTVTASLILGLSALAAAQVPDCTPITPGTAPISDPDSVAAFNTDPQYSEIANNATTPAGYKAVFTDISAAYENKDSYLTYYKLSKYNVQSCANLCNDTGNCKSFNIYVLRIPTQQPGEACPDPPASATYRCVLFSEGITVGGNTNVGQNRGPANSKGTTFMTAFRASNGYDLIVDDCTATVTSYITSFVPTTAVSTTTVYGDNIACTDNTVTVTATPSAFSA
ncbi:hypothetical protein K458DRAFT_487868 [Lentithecium fluviatile CBS 122367]|uniref:Apple domain-containing protein n=1 Tax=Lentithecium fluviatile CBS 122367 TaxID=1168545 RepID=A0A6G1J0P3_9PLEO|nr:hypothetical protein K458DRAFT_487868 [Lentithecium fluviatile CBS 122367]